MSTNVPVVPTVQVRDLSFKELAQKAWGKDWTKPEVAYEFTGRKFESTDEKQGGPYSPTHG